jgi:exoribonuclease R
MNGEFRVTICDRLYKKWYLTNIHTNERICSENPLIADISPIFQKWLSGDIVKFADAIITTVQSPARLAPFIAGVLVLENNRTFGRTANKKRLLYKCVPNNTQYPSFLVPYESFLGFSKHICNKYVLFRFDSWGDTRPRGLLTEVLGDVSNREIYHDYQLYCRNLRHSLTPFIRTVRDSLEKCPSHKTISQIRDNPSFHIREIPKNTAHIFSIDPDNSTDLDDAFSIAPHPSNGNTVVSVYIANVFVWLETMQLWNIFSNRVSTIYLPEQKLSMLPPILSDTLCSLLENKPRFAFTMNVEITPDGVILPETATFHNQLIYVSKNYRYESRELLADPKYTELLNITRLADPNVCDSHEVVAFWMVQMNIICGSVLFSNQTGIFRATVPSHNSATQSPTHTLDKIDIDESTQRFFRNWKNTNCMYCPYSVDAEELIHTVMNVRTYSHITSPIRRLVDILNQTCFVYYTGMVSNISEDALRFSREWFERIHDINTAVKSIRKLQSDCEMLHMCSHNPSVIANAHDGILFEKSANDDGTFSYMVYLRDLRRVARVRTIEEYNNYSTHSFRIFLFTDEDNIQNKVRLQIAS